MIIIVKNCNNDCNDKSIRNDNKTIKLSYTTITTKTTHTCTRVPLFFGLLRGIPKDIVRPNFVQENQ